MEGDRSVMKGQINSGVLSNEVTDGEVLRGRKTLHLARAGVIQRGTQGGAWSGLVVV